MLVCVPAHVAVVFLSVSHVLSSVEAKPFLEHDVPKMVSVHWAPFACSFVSGASLYTLVEVD